MFNYASASLVLRAYFHSAVLDVQFQHSCRIQQAARIPVPIHRFGQQKKSRGGYYGMDFDCSSDVFTLVKVLFSLVL